MVGQKTCMMFYMEAKKLISALEDIVGIACKNKECGVFIGIRGLSTDNQVIFINQDSVAFLDKCMVCGAQAGFEKVLHIRYHARYLEEEEDCDYCGKL